MKKIILLSLIVIAFSNPCLAYIEPEGLFGIGGTLWVETLGWVQGGEMGFYGVSYF